MASIVKSINDKLFIDSSGDVGIGTPNLVSTNLVGSLTVYKSYNGDGASIPSITAQNYYENQSGLYLFGRNSGLTLIGANGENNEIVFANASSKAYAKIGTTNGTTSTGGDMYFNTGGNVETMRISSLNNVLIGTTANAGYKLDVNGASRIVGEGDTLTLQKSNSVPALAFTGTSTNKSVIEGGDNFNFYTGGSSRIYINNAGVVGVGTTPNANWGTGFNYSATQFRNASLYYRIAGAELYIGNNSYYDGSNWRYMSTAAAAMLELGNNNFEFYSAASGTSGNSFTWSSRMKIVGGTGNVLIGTTTDAGYKLDVNGSLRATTGVFTIEAGTPLQVYQTNATNQTTAVIRQTTAGGNGNQDIGLLVDIQGAADTDRIANFRYYDGSTYTSRMAIMRGGNVGIGTTAPASKLHAVSASSGVSARTDLGGTIIAEGGTRAGLYILTAGTAAGSYGSIWWGNGNTNTDAYITVGNDTRAMDFGTADGFRMRITSTGNVGIGTSSPRTKTEFASGLPTSIPTRTNTTNGIVVTDGGDIYGRIGVSNFSAGGNGYPTYIQAGDWSGAVYYNLLLNPLGGNVGIGTTSPAEKLDVNGGTTIRGNLTFDTTRTITSNAVGTFLLTNPADAGIIELNAGTTAAYKTKINVYGRGNGNGITFTTQDVERMRISDAGNVLIGTTTDAGYKLRVVGGSTNLALGADGTVLDVSGASGKACFMGFDGGGMYQEIVGSSASTRVLRLQVYDGTSAYAQLFIDGANKYIYTSSNANVGIGTASPVAKLEVSGSEIRLTSGGAYGSIVAYNTGATGGTGFLGYQNGVGNAYFGVAGWYLGNTDTGIIIATDSSSRPIRFYTNFEQMRIAGNGNVLIGTTTDSGYKLDVAGTFRASTSGIVARMQTSTNASEVLQLANSGGDSGSVQGTTHLGINFFSVGTNSPVRITAYQNGTSGYAGGMYFSTRSANSDSAPVEAMRITHDQLIGLGPVSSFTTTHRVWIDKGSSTYAVYSQGSIQVNAGAIGVGVTPSATTGRIDAGNDIVAYSTSDSRLKENITPIANALDKVKSLTGVEFDWKEETKGVHGYEGHDVGVIAQEVQAVLPEAIRTNDTGYLSVRYEKMIALLIEGMKEQQNQIDELKAKLDGLTK